MKLAHPKNLHSRCKIWKLPTKMNADLSWLVGAIHATGSVDEYSVRLAIKDEEFLHKPTTIIKEQFEYPTNIDYDNYYGEIKLIINSKQIAQFFNLNTCGRYRGHTIQIPQPIHNTKYIMSYLAGYLDMDGHIGDKITFRSSSLSFIDEWQRILKAMDIKCTVRTHQPNKKGNWAKQQRTSKKLTISSTKSINKLKSLLVDSLKMEILDV